MKRDGKPVIVRCPQCQPGPYLFAGVIVPLICTACRLLLGPALRIGR